MIKWETIRLLLSLAFMGSLHLISGSMFYLIGVESFEHALMALVPFILVVKWDTYKKIAEKIAGCKLAPGDRDGFK